MSSNLGSPSASHRRRTARPTTTTTTTTTITGNASQNSASANNAGMNHNHFVEPSPDSKDANSKGGHRFWDIVRRAARSGSLPAQFRRGGANRTSDIDHSDRSGGDTLLPTTYNKMKAPKVIAMGSPIGNYRKTMASHSHSHSHFQSNNGSGSSPSKSTKMRRSHNLCASMMNNSFLMGGVDKRRVRRKPRGLLWRVFWSSLPRRLCIGFFLLYVVVYHVLVPFGHWLLFGGASAASGFDFGTTQSEADILKRLVHSPRFDRLPSIQHAKTRLGKIDKERDALREHGSHRGSSEEFPSRWKVLEAIAPEFFHRFDSDGDTNADADSTEGSEDESEDENEAGEDAGEAKALSDTTADAIGGGNDTPREGKTGGAAAFVKKNEYHKVVSSGNHRRRLLEVTGGIKDETGTEHETGGLLLPMRTFQNQATLAAEFSSCGKSQNQATPQATTLVVQTSIDRMWILGETCSRYNTDPIIAVIFVPHSSTFDEKDNGDEDHALLLDELHASEKRLVGGGGAKGEDEGEVATTIACPNLTLVRYHADRIESIQGRYPVNRLRNVGLDLVETSHVLMIDVDLLPSADLGRLLKDDIANSKDSANNNANPGGQKPKQKQRRAIVVPAFEKKPPSSCRHSEDLAACLSKFLKNDGAFLPRTFDELHACYTSSPKQCIVFQSTINWDGHSTTKSERWMQKKWYHDESNSKDATVSTRSFRKISCFDTPRYEPYVVLEWCPISSSSSSSPSSQIPLAPYYDERFYGYGKNKIELVAHLRKSGYSFEVLPEGFLVHNPHLESSTKDVWNNKGGALHQSMDNQYGIFLSEMGKAFKSFQNATGICDPKKIQN